LDFFPCRNLHGLWLPLKHDPTESA
jgi:hypothetical protein